MKNNDNLWSHSIHSLIKEDQISEQENITWFSFITLVSIDESKITLNVPSKFYKDQFNQRFYQIVNQKLKDLSNKDYIIELNIKKIERSLDQNQVIPQKTSPHPQLHPDYTFENFIVGNNNFFAASAAQSISKNPGHQYNPCLIYGGVGLGKTHLLQSIGNYIHSHDPSKKIVYIPAETFINEFIFSIRNTTQQNFKSKYRKIDVLLIDDIHDLQGKTETQEELFHTFNTLYNSSKQMVFTCDRPPYELKDFKDRLISRFERGLNVDLQPPDYETRYAILKKKLENSPDVIPDEVLELIAKNLKSNVRDLEASITKLMAYAELVNKKITMDIAKNQLKSIFLTPSKKNITIQHVQKVVSDYFGISTSDLKGKKRTNSVIFPRQLAMYIIRNITDFSTTEIGLEFGGRDHTTVMHSQQKIEDLTQTDSNTLPLINNLIRNIKEE